MSVTNVTMRRSVGGSLDETIDLLPATTAGQVVGLTAALAGKQPELVSGSTIKTINGESVLGAGTLTIDFPALTPASSADVQALFSAQ